jgi:hypothetical protein
MAASLIGQGLPGCGSILGGGCAMASAEDGRTWYGFAPTEPPIADPENRLGRRALVCLA